MARRTGRINDTPTCAGKWRPVPFWFCNVPPVLVEILQRARSGAMADARLGLTRTSDDQRVPAESLAGQRGLMDEADSIEPVGRREHQPPDRSRDAARPVARPRDHGERMIANNFAAMQTVEQWAAGKTEPVDLAHIGCTNCNKSVTARDDAEINGRFRAVAATAGEARVYGGLGQSARSSTTPPPADELPERIATPL